VSVPAAGQDQRLAVFGALDYASGQVVSAIAEHKNGAGFATFLAEIAQAWPDDHLVLVLDNVSYHRAPAVRTWWAAQEGRITPFWLPAYAPNLNLIERVWRFLKQKLACHRFWADREGLQQTAATLLTAIEAHFHAEEPPGIRLSHNFCQSA
jgi:transposase